MEPRRDYVKEVVLICGQATLVVLLSTFRRGYTMLQLDKISGGVYNISPCTFRPGEEGPFFLDINSSSTFTLSQLR